MIEFTPSEGPTLGVEWEIALIDRETMDLVPLAESVVKPLALEDGLAPKVHRELLTNTVELVTGKCHDVPEVVADLSDSLSRLRRLTDDLGLELISAGTHPFAKWEAQEVSEGERYATLIDRTQWWGRQMLIYGVHVHVGIEDRDKVLPIIRALLTVPPMPVSVAIWPAKKPENAVAKNHAPMAVLTMRWGASFVIIERPTGERHSSPVVCRR